MRVIMQSWKKKHKIEKLAVNEIEPARGQNTQWMKSVLTRNDNTDLRSSSGYREK